MERSALVEKKILVLKERFLEQLPDRVSAISQALLRASAENGASVRELERLFHSLYGTAGTYGVHDVAALAAAGEDLCREAGEGMFNPDVSRRVNTLVARLHAAVSGLLNGEETEQPAPQPARRRVLLAGISGVEMTTLAARLEKEGLDVTTATSMAAARSHIAFRLPDVVIGAMTLPDGSAISVVDEVRSLPSGDDVVMILVGAPEGPADRLRAMGCRADAWFQWIDCDGIIAILRSSVRDSTEGTMKVLCVEDDPHQAAWLKAVLEFDGYQVTTVSNPAEFEVALTTEHPDLLILDVGLPGITGFDLARYIRQRPEFATVPVLFLSGERSVESQLHGVYAGGDDYLVKPVEPNLLLATMRSRLRRSRVMQNLIELDGLTGALTRGATERRIDLAIREVARGKPYALVVLDIDHFKSVNDRFGHGTGDRVLIAMASVLRSKLRAGDVIGRWGGEEFVILLPNIKREEACMLMWRLLADFRALDHDTGNGSELHVTFSAGVTGSAPGEASQVWVARADRAMYAAKTQGRARVVLQ